MKTPIEKVLEVVDRYEQRHNGFWCICPAHDDHDPSLHVSETEDGTVLLKCRAGCSQPAVLERLKERGIEKRDLFADDAGGVVPFGGRPKGFKGRRKNRGSLAKIYEIKDASGRLVAFHERWENGEKKDFLWKHPDGNYSNKGKITAADMPLYGAELVAGWPDGCGIVVTEGETPAEALRAADVRALGTVTGASGTPNADILEILRDHKVILWPDGDLEGLGHMQRIGAKLTGVAAEVRMYEWPDPPAGVKGPDAADHPAVQSRDPQRLRKLRSALGAAPRGSQRHNEEASQDAPSGLTGRVLIGARLAGGVDPPEDLLSGILLAGKLHKIFSGPGVGKTFLALWISREIVRLGKTVLYLDAENGPSVVTERLKDLGAAPEEIDRGFHYFPSPDLTLEKDVLAHYLATFDRVRPDLVVFDSWVDFLTLAGLDENSATEVTSWVHALAGPAKERGAAVLLLDHVPTDANRSRGSTQKLGKVDVSWALKKALGFDRQTLGQIELRLEKDREGWLPKLVRFAIGGGESGFVFRKDTEVFEESDPTDDLTASQREIYGCIVERHEDGARWKDIKDYTGLAKSTISEGLKKLSSSNLITNEKSRYYARSRTEPSLSIDKPNTDGSEEFDSGSVEPREPGTTRGGSGGSVTFRDRTSEPGARPCDQEDDLDDLRDLFEAERRGTG